jgi:hypothetical protein
MRRWKEPVRHEGNCFCWNFETSLTYLWPLGGLCGGIFIDEAFEYMCKNRLGRKWDRLSKAGIKEIMKGEWEVSIKPQFKPMVPEKEYIVAVPAEAFGKTSLDDTSKQPFIRNGRIHFKG